MEANKKKNSLTAKESHRAIAWFADRLGLQDWKFDIWRDTNPPMWHNLARDTCGACKVIQESKRAYLWVSPERSAADGLPPLETLFHELLHVMAYDAGLDDVDQSRRPEYEYVWNRLATILAFAYQKQNPKKK